MLTPNTGAARNGTEGRQGEKQMTVIIHTDNKLIEVINRVGTEYYYGLCVYWTKYTM